MKLIILVVVLILIMMMMNVNNEGEYYARNCRNDFKVADPYVCEIRQDQECSVCNETVCSGQWGNKETKYINKRNVTTCKRSQQK